MANIKEEFIKWCKQIPQNKGDGYSNKSINNYVNFLNNLYFYHKEMKDDLIFDVDSGNVDEIIEMLKKSDKELLSKHIKNLKPGKNILVARDLYAHFLMCKFEKGEQLWMNFPKLSDIESNNTYLISIKNENQEEKFKNWLLNYDKKTISTTNSYIGDMKAWFNKKEFAGYSNFFDIKGYQILKDYIETFSDIDFKERSKEFDEFDKKRHNQATQAGLKKYIEFLFYCLNKQLIFYGAPGTGKSYELNKRAEDNFSENNIERVTFHPSLTYGAFVGSFKPYSKDEKITYKYIAGVFIRHLVKALKNENENYLLIIEEINRANTAAVFGDMFQLLDRDKNGESEYEISISDELKEYLDKESVKNLKNNKLYLPNNFYIWATMNNADQGVMPLDTAFKRRWDFEYMPLDADSEDKKLSEIGEKWNKLRKAINEKLLSLGINEDKLLGFYFLNGKALENEENYLKALQNKVLMYLYEDVLRHCRVKVFGNLAFANISQMSLEDIEKLFVNKQNEAE